MQQPTTKGLTSTPCWQPADCSGDFAAAGLDRLPLLELLRSQQSWACSRICKKTLPTRRNWWHVYKAAALVLKNVSVTHLNGCGCCLRRVPGTSRHTTTTKTRKQWGAHHEQDFVVGAPKAIGHIQRRLRSKDRVEAADRPAVHPEQAGRSA